MTQDGRKFAAIVLVASMAIGAALAIGSGKLILWDLRNYHFYNAHVLWTGRFGVDFNPAFFQSHINPVFYLPFYGLIQALPDWVAAGLLGALHGVNFWLLFRVSRLALAGVYTGLSRVGFEALSLFAALLGVAGPQFLPLIGSSSAELLSSLLILGGMWALLAAPGGRAGRGRCVWGALCFGLAVGAKWTNAPFAIAFVVVLVATRWRHEGFAGTLLAVALAGAVGGVLLGGPWMVALWTHYQSPVFPFYNAIFASPYTGAENFRDMRFAPDSFWAALWTYPLDFLVGRKRTLETPLRDPRWVFLMVLALLALARLRAPARLADASVRKAPWGLLGFVGLSYAIWLGLFAYHRYLFPIELLAGPCLVACVGMVVRESWVRGVVLAGVALGILFLTQPPRHWPRTAWTGSWLEVAAPRFERPDRAWVAILTPSPVGYLVPFFPKEVRFARILAPKFEGHALWREMDETLRSEEVDRWALVEPAKSLRVRDRRYLEALGIEVDRDRCQPVVTQDERFDLCELKASPSSQQASESLPSG